MADGPGTQDGSQENPAPADTMEKQAASSVKSAFRLQVMLGVAGILATIVFVVVYKLLTGIVTKNWECGAGTWTMDYPVSNDAAAVSNVTYAIEIGLTSEAEYRTLRAMQFTMVTLYMFPIMPAVFLTLYGWQMARGTVVLVFPFALLFMVWQAFFADDGTWINTTSLTLAWIVSTGLMAWKAWNRRLILGVLVMYLVSAIIGTLTGLWVVPAFIDNTPPGRVVIRSVMGLAFAAVCQALSDAVMNWATRGEKRVPCTLYGKYTLGLVCFTLRLLQSSVSDMREALIMEGILQLVQITQAVINIEWGGAYFLFEALVCRCLRRFPLRRFRPKDIQEPLWVTDAAFAQEQVGRFIFKEYIDIHSIITSTFLALMIPFTFDDEPKETFTTVMNGILQFMGEAIAIALSRAYLHWRLKFGAKVFDFGKHWSQICITDKIAMAYVAFATSLIMITTIAQQLCWSCGGNWVQCSLRGV